MENILQDFDDTRGCQTISFQEPLQSMQAIHHLAPPLSSYQCVSFGPQQIREAAISSRIGSIQQFDEPVMLLDGNKDETLNYSAVITQCPNGENMLSGDGTEKTEQGWQRVRWTDDMVKVLISAVSYFSEVAFFDGPEIERSQIKGKWKSISKAMVERGYIVSPQQCEDKFNDLNKKYKRLNHLLGTDTWYDVVENMALMEGMNIPEESKEEVRKILACKQLFYKEMHSYHNKNRRFLPHDESLQESVLSNLKSRAKYCSQDLDDGIPVKKRKHGEENGVTDQEQQELSEWIILRSMELEKKKLRIQNQMLELDEEKFEWLRSCQVEDEELHKMKLENKLMRLENERLAFELKCRDRDVKKKKKMMFA